MSSITPGNNLHDADQHLSTYVTCVLCPDYRELRTPTISARIRDVFTSPVRLLGIHVLSLQPQAHCR